MPTIVCPGCQAKLKVDEKAGNKLRCPQCQTRIRVDETGEVSFVSETVRAPAPKPRKSKSASAGWVVYGLGAALVSVLLVVVWQATSRTTPNKSEPPGGALLAEQDADAAPVSHGEKEATPADDVAAEARKQLHSLAHSKVKRDSSSSTVPSISPSSSAKGPALAKAEELTEKSPKISPKAAVPAKEDAETQQDQPKTAADAQPTINLELADAITGKLDEGVAKTVGQWQQASTAFAAEKVKTTDSAKLKSLAANDPAKTFGSQLLELGEKDPKSPAAFQAFVAALYVLRDSNLDLTGDLVGRAAKHLTDRATDQEMGRVALLAAPLCHPSVHRLLQSILDKTEQRDDRGRACFALIKNLKLQREQVSEAAALKRIDKQTATLVRRIEKEEFGDVTIDNQPIAAALKALAETVVQQLTVGSVAPDIVGKDLDGKRLKLSDYRGKVVMLEFWAGWCPYCRKLIPDERALVSRLKDRPFALLGVNVDKKTDAALIQRKKVTTWRSWQDGPNGPIGIKYQIRGYPTFFLLDRKGKIRYVGSSSQWQFYDSVIKDLLAETEDGKDSKSASSE
jgi:thiol-disulfide isomerase/thioredoxin